jgi:chromosome segregation ATPase
VPVAEKNRVWAYTPTLREQLSATTAAAQVSEQRHQAELSSAMADATQHRTALEKLRQELAHETTEVRVREQQLVDLREHHQNQRNATATETQSLAERLREAQRERDQAREAAANLQGRFESQRDHVAELSALLKAFGADPSPSAPSAM